MLPIPRKPAAAFRALQSGLCALLLCGALVPAASRAQAPAPTAPTPDPAQDAAANRPKELFNAGVQAFEEGRFTEALANFEQAYQLKPHPLVQVNIANCYDKLNQPAEALDHFEAFLASPEGTPAQRDEVRAAVTRLSKQAGRLSLQVTPATATGTLDDQTVLHPPNQWVSAGRHRLSFVAEGFEPVVRVLDVRAGETTEVSVTLVPLPPPTLAAQSAQAPAVSAAALPAPKVSSPAGTSHPLPANVWISGGATLGLGVVAVVTGQLALAANREFDTNLSAVRNSMLTEYQRAGAWARGVDAANRADALAAVTDVLLAMTLVGAGLTTYFYLADRNQTETPTSRVTLHASPRAGQVAVQGTF
jgi:hypothetical protein